SIIYDRPHLNDSHLISPAASLIQEMNSDDPVVQQRAVLETEKRLRLTEEVQEEDGCRTALNKTVISPPQAPSQVSVSVLELEGQNPRSEAFLASVESDAKERARRRRENKVLADALRERGNGAFARGDYEAAVLCYSEGLEKLRDMKVLYTNRAQAYMKLGDFQKALVDCEWALKCDEKCTKAYFHMGKAHLALKNYSASRECYQKMLEINPQLQTQVKEYLNQVNLQEKAELQEKEAHTLLGSGKNTAVTIKNVLETLCKPHQTPLFYAGGIEILTEVIKDCPEQTLFRTNNGFSIISENEVIRRCFSTAGEGAVEETVCVSVLRLWQVVCAGNEENQRLLLCDPDTGSFPGSLRGLLAGGTVGSRTAHSKLLLDFCSLLEALVSFLDFSDKKANSAMELLTDLALEERFRAWFRASLPGVLPALTGVLRRDPVATNRSALCQCIALMGNFSAEAAVRRQMCASEEFGDACLGLMARCEVAADLCREVLYTLLGLVMNLCLQCPHLCEVWAVEVSRRCLLLLNSQDGGILTRAAGILSRTLASSGKMTEEALRAGVVRKMMKFLKVEQPPDPCAGIGAPPEAGVSSLEPWDGATALSLGACDRPQHCPRGHVTGQATALSLGACDRPQLYPRGHVTDQSREVSPIRQANTLRANTLDCKGKGVFVMQRRNSEAAACTVVTENARERRQLTGPPACAASRLLL
uniref:Tetratricopeptide repeat protein 12 n=1 Tax=Suricata suricatta TaxID=37032 RepID=A0A673UPH3_SURSU